MALPASERGQAPVTCLKTWDEVREYVSQGYVDFVAITEFWRGPPPIPPPHVVRIPAWGIAVEYGDRGFYVFADSLDELGHYISYLVEANKDVWAIYVRVSVLGIEPRWCSADVHYRNLLMGGRDV